MNNCTAIFKQENKKLVFKNCKTQFVVKSERPNFVFKFGGVIDNSGGGSPVRVYNEALTGVINGSNATFTAQSNFVQGSEEIKIRGVTQLRQRDYTLSPPNIVQFTSSPEIGDTLLISYNRI